MQHREAERLAAGVVRLGHAAGQGAHAQDVALALGHRNRLAGIEQVERVRGLEHPFVGRQREFDLEHPHALLLVRVELAEQLVDVGVLEVVLRLLDLVLVVDVAVGDAAERTVGPDEIEHALDTLQVHREALEAVGDLAHDGPAVEPAHLLEVRELRDLHAVQPDFPAEAPGAERRRLPVVLDQADVVHERVDADRAQRAEVQLDQVGRRRLDRHLVLVVVLQAERVVAVATVGRPARGLHVRGAPGLGPDRAQERGGVERARTDLHVVGLEDDAAPLGPIALQCEQEVLEGAGRLGHFGHGNARGGRAKGGSIATAQGLSASSDHQSGTDSYLATALLSI